MIISSKTNRSNSRWLQICVLLCAVVVLPLGIASAQDYEAVERRLGVGVAEGELTLKQASIMMDALKKAGGAKKDQDSERAKAYLMKVKKELGELVEAGKISKEDAAKRYGAAEKGIKERIAAASRQRGGERQRTTREDKRSAYEGFERRIKAAVREGKMTRAEAGEQLKGFRRRMEMAERGERGESGITIEEYRRAEAKMRKMIEDGKAKPEDVERRLIEMRKMIGGQSKRGGERQRTTRGDKRAEYEGFERRIKAAVREGKMTREEAGEQLKGFRRRIEMTERGERGERGITVEEYRRAEAKMRKMVEAGKAKPEDVERRLIEMRKMMGRQRERSGERGDRERGERRFTREDYARAEAKLKKLVDEGKISEEDLQARLGGMRRMMAGQAEPQRTTRDDKRGSYEGFERRIKAAVEAGKMTREEAGEKLEDYRKRLGKTRDGDTDKSHDLEAIARRLKAAVKAGELTEEEAEEKIEDYKKRIGR